MKKIYTLQQQQQQFKIGHELFLQGQYEEAEAILRLVVESAFQHEDYTTYVSSMILLNRLFINTTQIHKMYMPLQILRPLIQKYGSEEDHYFYRMHEIIFHHFNATDMLTEFEQLFEDVIQTQHQNVLFLIGSNLMLHYFEIDAIDKGLALYHRLNPLFDTYNFQNNMTRFMHIIYAFLLFYKKQQYDECAAALREIETNPNVTIVESFSYMYFICKALLDAQTGDINSAKELFKTTLRDVENLSHLRIEIKMWIQVLQQFNLKDDVIYYQNLMIDILESRYSHEVGAIRKAALDDLSRQFFEGKAYIDQLTNVKNRNFYEDLLSKQQQVKNYTVAVLDIDKFKLINDTYGHTVGDKAITFIAQHLNNWHVRHDISIIRYGGDEFIILMPYNYAEMTAPLQSLHEKIMTTPLHVEKLNITIPLSISMGIGYTTEQYETIQTLFDVADRAIYEAKKTRGAVYAHAK